MNFRPMQLISCTSAQTLSIYVHTLQVTGLLLSTYFSIVDAHVVEALSFNTSVVFRKHQAVREWQNYEFIHSKGSSWCCLELLILLM